MIRYPPPERSPSAGLVRPEFDSKIIPLDEIKRRRARGPVPRSGQAGIVLSLAELKRPFAFGPSNTSALGRRRHIPMLRRWLPTAMFVGVLMLMALLFGAIRMLLQPLAGVEDRPVAAASLRAAAAERIQQPASLLPLEVAPAPPPVASRDVRFIAQPIEPSYTVGDGDNLWTIAQRYNANVEALQSINNLPDRAVLRIGQRLIIP